LIQTERKTPDSRYAGVHEPFKQKMFFGYQRECCEFAGCPYQEGV
jgi:hypothetical protein